MIEILKPNCLIKNRYKNIKLIIRTETISKFSINDVWNTLIKENNLFGFESKNKFIHVTDIKVYESLLKNN